MFIVSCPVEFFSPSGATSDVPRCRSLRSLGGLFLRNYKHFAPLGLRPQNPFVPGKFKSNQKKFIVQGVARRHERLLGKLSSSFPRFQDAFDLIRDFPARLSPVISSCEQRVVLCLHVPDVRPHGQADRLLVKTLGGGRSPDPATIFQTSVFGDSCFTSCGTARKEFSYSFCKTLYIHLVQFFSPNGFALSAPRSDFLVGQTFFFRFFQCRLFNEQSLPFIPFA